MIRPRLFIGLQLTLLVLVIIILAGPYIGLGENENFVLYRLFGVKRLEAFNALCLLIFCSWGYQVLAFAFLRAVQSSREMQQSVPLALARSIWEAGIAAGKSLFIRVPAANAARERIQTGILAGFFLIVFRLLSTRSIVAVSRAPDQHYHQAFVDYDIDWRTPVFSLAGNLLNNFGIQVPLNGNAAPILGLAHVLSPAREFEIALTLFFLCTALLLWILGGAFGLRPVARVMVAGTTALMVTIPIGLERIVYVVPPYLLTQQLILGLWWYEAGLYSLAASALFFFLGQARAAPANLVLAAGFAVVSCLLLLAFPAGAVFGIAVTVLYCLAFLITSRSRSELGWKLATGAVLGAALLAAGVPSFLLDLYGYAYSSHFRETVPIDVGHYVRSFAFLREFLGSSMAETLGRYDSRVTFIWGASLIIACLLVLAGPSPRLRRFAFAVIFLEIGMPIFSIVNHLTIQQGISWHYAEMSHGPFLFWFFAVLCMTLLFFVDRAFVRYLYKAATEAKGKAASWFFLPLARYRLAFYFLLAAFVLRPYVLGIPPDQHALFPAEEPPSVALLKADLAVQAGKPFRGRTLVLGGTRAEAGNQWPDAPLGTYDVLVVHYMLMLGNDHYIDLLGLGIPDATEYGHWTSPVTFTFLRAFFAHPDDVAFKAFFPLRVFNPRIARLMGIRMIVTDAEQLPDTTLVYQTQAGEIPLRIFRLDGSNLGQYSPVHPRVAATAAEAIGILAGDSFDPAQDVVIEHDLQTTLVPATEVAVVTDLGPTLTVRAASSGWSLLALPFEYSACLRLNLNGGGSAKLLPVNLQQTGLLFQGNINASITYRFGPFDQPRCRRQDIERAERLRLRDLVRKERMQL